MSLDFAGFIPAIAGLAVGAAGLAMNVYERRRRIRMRPEGTNTYIPVRASSGRDAVEHGTVDVRPVDSRTSYGIGANVAPQGIVGSFEATVAIGQSVKKGVSDVESKRAIVFESGWLAGGGSPTKG